MRGEEGGVEAAHGVERAVARGFTRLPLSLQIHNEIKETRNILRKKEMYKRLRKGKEIERGKGRG